jgi:hypothetical protein
MSAESAYCFCGDSISICITERGEQRAGSTEQVAQKGNYLWHTLDHCITHNTLNRQRHHSVFGRLLHFRKDNKPLVIYDHLRTFSFDETDLFLSLGFRARF